MRGIIIRSCWHVIKSTCHGSRHSHWNRLSRFSTFIHTNEPTSSKHTPGDSRRAKAKALAAIHIVYFSGYSSLIVFNCDTGLLFLALSSVNERPAAQDVQNVGSRSRDKGQGMSEPRIMGMCYIKFCVLIAFYSFVFL